MIPPMYIIIKFRVKIPSGVKPVIVTYIRLASLYFIAVSGLPVGMETPVIPSGNQTSLFAIGPRESIQV